eukprot:m.25293 g.25293  ORF g.25293 m.25293 type:complete len:50 (+) comp28773_c0_seq2:485-634(+)
MGKVTGRENECVPSKTLKCENCKSTFDANVGCLTFHVKCPQCGHSVSTW